MTNHFLKATHRFLRIYLKTSSDQLRELLYGAFCTMVIRLYRHRVHLTQPTLYGGGQSSQRNNLYGLLMQLKCMIAFLLNQAV